MIVRTDLAQKRADKLAKRNPKKERLRPAVPAMSAPAPTAAPAAAPVAAPAAEPAVVEETPQA
jgi:hypothetical protein